MKRLIALLVSLCLLLAPQTAIATVAFEAGSTAIGSSGVVTSDSSGLSITLTAASNSILFIGLTFSGNPGAITSVKWGSAAMTQVGSTFTGDSTFYVAVFALLNPGSGTNTYTATWTNSVAAVRCAAQFSGVTQVSVAAATPNVATNNGATSPGTATVTTTNGDAAFYSAAISATTGWNTTTVGTQINEHAGNGVDGIFSYRLASGASTQISTSAFGNTAWDAVSIDVAQATAAGAHNLALMGVGK